MFDPEPFLRRPFTTSSAIAADALGFCALRSWDRVYERNDAHREGLVKANAQDRGRETPLRQSVGMRSASEIISAFSSPRDVVIEEMRAKGFQAGPNSFKGWNDVDAAFVGAIFERNGSERLTGFIAAGQKKLEIVVPDGGVPEPEIRVPAADAEQVRAGQLVNGDSPERFHRSQPLGAHASADWRALQRGADQQ